MNKRLLVGLIVLFLALAAKDGLPAKPATKDSLGNATQTPANLRADLLPVVRIVDGDTIVVLVNGVSEKIRLIGVDTPETVDPRKPVQCFGEEASTFMTTLLSNKQVRLENDPSQGDRDKYGRLLRYVFLADNTLVNKKLIEDGYGHEYTYRLPYQYQLDFKNAEKTARESQKGLWKPSVCNP